MRAPLSRAEAAAEFARKLNASLADGRFVRLVLSSPTVPSPGPARVLGRLVDLKGAPHLSLTFQYPTRDEVKNIKAAKAGDWVRPRLDQEFGSALLGTASEDWQFSAAPDKPIRLWRHSPTCTVVPSRAHDQARKVLLDSAATDWLHGLEVTDAHGKVRASMADKYVQINRYLEIFSHLALECGWATAPDKPRPLEEFTVADMGSGKGYLTFGLWHLMHRLWGWPVRITGIEARPELVATTNALAQRIGASGLGFVAGTIGNVALPKLRVLIALHACDTASDQAIARGVELGSEIVLIAPCCHQQLRPQLSHPPVLAPVLRHGIMEERLAEWLTDGLRALYLELAGYRTKIIEFVESEHTPKNLMIAGIKQREPVAPEMARRRITELKAFFGISTHPLDSLLTCLTSHGSA